MDWLLSRQDAMEKKLAARHLEAGGLALFDLSSAWLEGHSCPLGAFGHSRDGKKSREQIEFGMVTSRAGIPVAVRVFAGNTSDSVAFGEIIPVVRDKLGLGEVILVGDRGSVTQVRIRQLKALPGAGWITALRAPQVAALARDDGPLQMSLFDDQNFAEITDARYPGERLICCRNPALAGQRAAKRRSLLEATEKELGKIRASVQAGRVKDADKIGVKVGKVINKRKVGKHFITDIADSLAGVPARSGHTRRGGGTGRDLRHPHFRRGGKPPRRRDRRSLQGAREPRPRLLVDEIRTDRLAAQFPDRRHRTKPGPGGCAGDPCTLATYLTWHLRQVSRRSLSPIIRNHPAKTRYLLPQAFLLAPARSGRTHGENHPGEQPPIRGHQELIAHLATLTRNTVSFAGQRLEKLSAPTPNSAAHPSCSGKPIPLRLDATQTSVATNGEVPARPERTAKPRSAPTSAPYKIT